jgi:hypothetical protein
VVCGGKSTGAPCVAFVPALFGVRASVNPFTTAHHAPLPSRDLRPRARIEPLGVPGPRLLDAHARRVPTLPPRQWSSRADSELPDPTGGGAGRVRQRTGPVGQLCSRDRVCGLAGRFQDVIGGSVRAGAWVATTSIAPTRARRPEALARQDCRWPRSRSAQSGASQEPTAPDHRRYRAWHRRERSL